MAQLIGLNVYQINQMDPIPLASVSKIDFPFAGILVRALNTPGTTGQALTTGQVVYSQIQLITTGVQYSVVETAAALAALS
jgi:hypothetical protein